MVVRKRASPPRRLTLEDLEGISKWRLGFTGKSDELDSWDQVRILAFLLGVARRWPHAIWVTGGCVGVDAFIAMVGHATGFHVHTVLPANHVKVDQEWKKSCTSYYQMPNGTDYMDRNDELVNRSTHMGGAFPDGPEQQRSGTWATVRRFRRKGVKTTRIVVLN